MRCWRVIVARCLSLCVVRAGKSLGGCPYQLKFACLGPSIPACVHTARGCACVYVVVRACKLACLRVCIHVCVHVSLDL